MHVPQAWWAFPALAAFVLAGCSGGPVAAGDSAGKELHLYVSNQSFEQPTADVQVKVDGRVLFDGQANVEDQHNWMLREDDLDPGQHTVTAWERTSGAQASETFTLPSGAQRWVVVDYWTGTASGAGTDGPHFTIGVNEQQVRFD